MLEACLYVYVHTCDLFIHVYIYIYIYVNIKQHAHTHTKTCAAVCAYHGSCESKYSGAFLSYYEYQDTTLYIQDLT